MLQEKRYDVYTVAASWAMMRFKRLKLRIVLGGLLLLTGGIFLDLQAQTPGNVDVGASPTPEIQLGLKGGTNQFGKRTILTGSAIDFGNVSFIHPETIMNGDAFLEDGHLKLEAVIGIDVTFSGAASVKLELTRLAQSANPFHETYYSLSLDRAQAPTKVLDFPAKNNLITITKATTVPLRMIFEISPQQKGRISDRFRLEANTL